MTTQQLSLMDQPLHAIEAAIRSSLARRTDPATSHEAPTRQALNGHRLRVLQVHRDHPDGLTDFELAELTGLAQTSCGCRRGELVRAGFIVATTERRPSPSGSSAIVWRVTS